MSKVKITVEKPFTLHMAEDFAKEHGMEGASKTFGAGNHTVPEAIADHWWVKKHSSPLDETPPKEEVEDEVEEETTKSSRRRRK